MHYATIDNRIGQADTLPEGAVEITRDRYKELIQAKAQGERVTVKGGKDVTYTVAYAPNGAERSERLPDEPLITAPPPEDLHVPQWQDGEWVEGETDGQRQEREARELDEARQSAYQRIKAAHAEALKDASERYSDTEREGWSELVTDAKSGEGSVIEGYAAKLGISTADAVDRILTARERYRQAYGQATGKLTKLRDQVDAAETVEALEAIQWDRQTKELAS